jgi:hypothetical protein
MFCDGPNRLQEDLSSKIGKIEPVEMNEMSKKLTILEFMYIEKRS